MATRYVYSGAGGANDGSSWTDAYTTYGAAITASTGAGDIIKVHYTHSENVAADTTYTAANHIAVLSVDKDSSDALTPMGTASWIGHDASSFSIFMAGAFKVYINGLTFRLAAGSIDSLSIATADGGQYHLENCYLWLGNNNTSSAMYFGSGAAAPNGYVRCTNTTLRFGATGQSARIRASVDFEGCTVSSAGSAPTNLFTDGLGGALVRWTGGDISHLGSNAIIGSHASGPTRYEFAQTKFGTSYTLIAASLSPANLGNAEVVAWDCHSGDTHGIVGHANAFGTMTSDTGIYFTSGAAGQSWKIVTTANCTFYTPYVSPWMSLWNETLSSMTPAVEILRDGSATAYQSDEVWAEFMAKVTSGSTQSTFYSDRMAPGGAAADQAAGAGTGSWTGESGTAWSGKCDSGSAITPAEIGDIMVRIAVGEASSTVYVNPEPA